MAQANIKAVITAEDRASATIGAFGNSVDNLGSKITGALKVASVAAFAATTAAIIGATKASWDQVDAVQQATVGLKAYEKNGDKVNAVLSDLIKYARSDMGVLFNRKDLFQSAQSLKIMGDSTEDLVGHVQILSRSVGLGLSNWTDLNLIVGRVGSTGRLTGEDFDNLTKAGFRLDSGLRNTDITFSELFKHLDKGIPSDALAGQADTIQGKFIRLETAFRGVGDAILGVDKDTGKFVKGGLGAALVDIISKITAVLSTPEFKQGIKDTMKGIADGFKIFLDVVKQILTFLQPLTDYMLNNKNAMEVLKYTVIGLAVALAAIVVSVGLVIYALTLVGIAVADITTRFVNFMNGIYVAMGGVVSAVANGVNQAVGWLASLPGKILGAIGNMGGLLYGVGKDIVNGLVNGIKDAVNGAVKAAKDLGKSVLKAAEDAVGRHSPAKEFIAVGQDIGKGLGIGIDKGAQYAVDASKDMASSLIPSTSSSSIGRSSSVVSQNTPSLNITIQAGAFMGTQTDARKLAKMVFDSYKELQAMGSV